MTTNPVHAAVRKLVGPANANAVDAFFRSPAIAATLEESEDADHAQRVARVARLAGIAPRYVKLRDEAGKAMSKAMEAEAAANEAARKSTQARRDAFAVLDGLDAKQRFEESVEREYLRPTAQPLIHASIVAVRNLSLAFVSVYLDDGKAPPPPQGIPKGFYEEPADVDAKGIALWQAAHVQQRATIQALDDALYLALRAGEAAELVEGEFRKLNACMVKLQGAPVFEVDKHGDVVFVFPKTGVAVLKAGEVIA